MELIENDMNDFYRKKSTQWLSLVLSSNDTIAQQSTLGVIYSVWCMQLIYDIQEAIDSNSIFTSRENKLKVKDGFNLKVLIIGE